MEPVISLNKVIELSNYQVNVRWNCIPLPGDVQNLIFFSLNEVGLKHASVVSKQWNKETITALKDTNLSDIQFFILKNRPHLNFMDSKEVEILLKSKNLADINHSMDEWTRKAIFTLKSLIHSQLDKLHTHYIESGHTPFDEIFHLTLIYKEIEYYLDNLQQSEKDIVTSLLTIEDLRVFFSNLDLYRINKNLIVKHHIFTLFMDRLLKDKNKFDQVLNSTENFSFELTENLFCHLTNCLKTNRMDTAQINKMIEVSITLLENSEIKLRDHMLSFMESMCKLRLRAIDSLANYPDFKTLFDLLSDNFPVEVNKIASNNLSQPIFNQLLQDDMPEISKPKRKKVNALSCKCYFVPKII